MPGSGGSPAQSGTGPLVAAVDQGTIGTRRILVDAKNTYGTGCFLLVHTPPHLHEEGDAWPNC